MRKIIVVFLVITTISLTGCMENITTDPDTPETVTGGGIAVDTPPPTKAPKEEVEIIALIKSIDKDGITFVPYSQDDPLYEKADSFFIKNENLKITKDGRTSIYDMVYFYDGMVVKFKGDFEKKTDYCLLTPEKGTQIEVALVNEYKEIAVQKPGGDETPVNIVNNNDNKADVELDGVFCKITLPPQYGSKVKINYNIDMETHTGSITLLYKNEEICEITKSELVQGKVIAKSGKYVYSMEDKYMPTENKKINRQVKKILSLVKKNFKVVNF